MSQDLKMSASSTNIVDTQMKFSSCLSAPELVSLRKNTNINEEFPCVIGQKCYNRNNTWLEEKAVECVLENQKEILNQKIASRMSDLIKAEWNADLDVAVTSKLKGKYVQHMGHMVEKKVHLSPEESVFLLQNRSIEILHKKIPMSLEEAYAVILKKNLSFEKYQVYSHLAQLGFIVVQHQPNLPAIRKENLNRSKKRKQKRKASTSLVAEPEEKRSKDLSSVLNESEVSNLSEPCITQDSSTLSNDCQNLQNTETLGAITESNESGSVMINNVQNFEPIVIGQFESDENKTSTDVDGVKNITCISESPFLNDKPESISNTHAAQQLNKSSPKKINCENSSSVNFKNSIFPEKSQHIKNVATADFKSHDSVESSQPLDDKDNDVTTEANVEKEASSANSVELMSGGASFPLIHFKPLVSDDAFTGVSDIANDLENIKKKYVPGQKFLEDYLAKLNNKSRNQIASDQESIEMDNSSESDKEDDVMSCSSEEARTPFDVFGPLPDAFLDQEDLADDEVTLVEVKKKETTPLAVIDILSDDEQTERISVGHSSDNDDEIQVVKVCSSSSKNCAGRNPYQSLNSIKKEQKYNVKGTHHKFMSARPVVFPDLFRKDVVCLSCPKPNLLPKNVKPAKEAYVLDVKRQPDRNENPTSGRLWNSYKDLQEYQRARRRNRNVDSCSWRVSRQENRRFNEHNPTPYNSNRNDAGHLFQNNFQHSHSVHEMLPTFSGTEFSGIRQSNNFNFGPMNMLPSMTGNIMADLHRAAYSFANNMLTSMMNQSMMNNIPQYNSFHPPRYQGNHSNIQSGHSNIQSGHSNAQSSAFSYESYLNNMKPSGHCDYGPGSSQQNDFQSPFNPLMNSTPRFPLGRDSPQNFNRNRDFHQRNFPRRGRPFPCVYRNVCNKRSWNEIKAVVERYNSSVDNEHNSDIEEVPIDINKVLWNSELHPLMKPGTRYPIEDALKSLQKTKMTSFFDEKNSYDRYLPSANQFLKITFDVYLPGSNYKKTCPDIPKYRIVVVRATDPIPKFSEIIILQKKWNDGAILQLAVVDNGDISFYSFNSVQSPQLIPHDLWSKI